jgi:hypothetical protein
MSLQLQNTYSLLFFNRILLTFYSNWSHHQIFIINKLVKIKWVASNGSHQIGSILKVTGSSVLKNANITFDLLVREYRFI